MDTGGTCRRRIRLLSVPLLNLAVRVGAARLTLKRFDIDQTGDLLKLLLHGRRNLGQTLSQALHAWTVFHRGCIQVLNEFERLKKVVIGGTSNQGMDRLGNRVGSHVVNLQENVQSILRSRLSITPDKKLGLHEDHTPRFNGPQQQRALVPTLAVKKMFLGGSVDQISGARGAYAIVGGKHGHR